MEPKVMDDEMLWGTPLAAGTPIAVRPAMRPLVDIIVAYSLYDDGAYTIIRERHRLPAGDYGLKAA